MARYIDADKIKSKLQEKSINSATTFINTVLIGLLDDEPTADVVEVKHGEWKPIVKQDNYFEPPYCDTCKCSVCAYEIDVSETVYNYCPECGAKMNGERKCDND